MQDKLNEALDHISDRHIAEAAAARRKRRPYWLGAVAAALALVILLSSVFSPGMIQAAVVSPASPPRMLARPDRDDYGDNVDAWRTDHNTWSDEQTRRQELTESALNVLEPFFRESSLAYLENSPDENRVWSPVNGYIALAMLAEVTDRESRQQVLAALGEENLEDLRTHVSTLWESVYQDDGHEIVTLANSLWLDKNLSYNQDTMDALAYHHYASVYQTDLSSDRADKDLQNWLNQNTGGLLKKQASGARFPGDAVLTLASTVYLQSKWGSEFQASNNTQDVFHAPDGDVTVTFMNKKQFQTDYYWADSFGAISLPLKNGTRMWLILPDEDKDVETVLREGQFWELLHLTYRDIENKKYMKVNISLPKFDISSGGDLAPMLQSLGITHIFDPFQSDFTAITSDSPVFVTAVNQAARVIVDEKGVKAASYIEIPLAGAAMPPEEIIDFILDRPFLFVLASTEGVPLFTGVVNDPS